MLRQVSLTRTSALRLRYHSPEGSPSFPPRPRRGPGPCPPRSNSVHLRRSVDTFDTVEGLRSDRSPVHYRSPVPYRTPGADEVALPHLDLSPTLETGDGCVELTTGAGSPGSRERAEVLKFS